MKRVALVVLFCLALMPRLAAAALPMGDIAALASSPDSLFIGMFDRGLYVLTGSRLEQVSSPALNPNVNALSYDAQQRALWVGTARGLVRCTGEQLSCERVGGSAGVHALTLLADGRLAAGGEGGLLLVAPSGTVELAVDRKHGAPFRGVWSLAQHADGTLFVGTTSGLYWGGLDTYAALGQAHSRKRSVLARAALVSGELPDDWVTALAFDGDVLHVGTYNAGLTSLRFTASSLQAHSRDPSPGYVNPAGITLLGNQELALATMDGLRLGRSGEFRTVPTPGRDVTAIVAAPNNGQSAGEYWVATRRGLMRLSTQ